MEQGVATLATVMISPAMITAWILVGVALLALGIVVYVALRSRTRRLDLEKALQAFRSLDIEAFRNLVDADEEEYLRHNLPPKKFRKIKRQRAWAALLYAWEAGEAATALARIGQAVQHSSDPEIAASGVQVAENAFRLRLQTVGVSFRLLTEIVLPGQPARPHPRLVDQYERTAQTLFRLGRFSPGSLLNN